MKDINLKAEMRELKRNELKKKRIAKKIPAVVYGGGKDNTNVWVEELDFIRTLSVAGENTVVLLNIDGKGDENVLIYDYQLDPITDRAIHIDFLRVDMNKKIEAEVPLEFIGEAPAVKEKGGTLIKSLSVITVKALPGNLPSVLKVDLSKLETFEDKFTVGDLKSSDEKVELMASEEIAIASVAQPRSDEEMAKLDEKVEEDVSQVEGGGQEESEVSGEKKTEDKKEEKAE